MMTGPDDSGAHRHGQLVRAEIARDEGLLRAALTSDHASERRLALGSLDRLGRLADGDVERACNDADRTVRVRAVELAIGRRDLDLVPKLADRDDLVVETAAWALGERDDASDRVVDALRGIAHTHDESICREAAVAALGALGSSRGLDAILAGLDDRAPVRRRAVLALAPFDGPEVRAALVRALDDRDRQVRQAAEDLL